MTMTDQEWIDDLGKKTTCREMLREIVENESFFGYDPYYAKLRKAMLDNADRVLTNQNHE